MRLILFKAICKFLSTRKLFTYLKKRYSKSQIKLLNSLLQCKGKARINLSSIKFLKTCLQYKVLPGRFAHRLKVSKVKPSLNIEQAFMSDEINTLNHVVHQLRRRFQKLWSQVREFISTIDMIRLNLYICKINQKHTEIDDATNAKKLAFLIKQRYGQTFKDGDKHITNLSSYVLSEDERFVLSHGLDFCIKPTCIDKPNIQAEFEIAYNQICMNVPVENVSLSSIKAHLASYAHSYCDGNRNTEKNYFLKEHFRAIKSLKTNENIVITKSDKGGGCVILDKIDYFSKMADILDDSSKFVKLGPVNHHDTTKKREKEFCNYIKSLADKKLLDESIISSIRPVGSTRPRLYGLPKTHKENVPLRPVLSTVGSFQQPLAKFLKQVLLPVYQKYSDYCITDSFSFANLINEYKCNHVPYLCSFDVKSLFTCIPIDEVIDICSETLYSDSNIHPPGFDRVVFEELMNYALCNIEFSFNDCMYRQINGLGMGNVLSSILANIYVGYHEIPCLNKADGGQKPLLYKRYVDDCFAMFECQNEATTFLSKLNQLNPALEFTVEYEQNESLPFLDVRVHKCIDGSFTTSIYRKPTFAGQYQNWNSFCPKQRKINLIDVLIHRAIQICSKCHIDDELQNIKEILSENGYPTSLIEDRIRRMIRLSATSVRYGPKKCPIYLHLPYLGEFSERMANSIRNTVEKSLNAVNFRVVFSTKKILPKNRKGVLPSHKVNLFTNFIVNTVIVFMLDVHQEDWIRKHVTRGLMQGR